MVKIDSISEAKLLNRYIVYTKITNFNITGGIENNLPKKSYHLYEIQWRNIILDLKGIFRNPFFTLPRIAYSLGAFLFILLGEHQKAIQFAFFTGAIAVDSAAQSSASGEPATISWTHTVSGSNRVATAFYNGLSSGLSVTFGGNAMTSIVTDVDATGARYYIAPSTGSNTVTVSNGNIKVGASISFTGADQTSPIGATTSSSGDASPFTVNLTTTTDNSIRVDVSGGNRDDATSPTVTLDSGTSQFNPVTPQNQFRIGIFGYTNAIASAGSTSRTWTTTAFTRDYIAFEMIAAAGTSTTKGSFLPFFVP